MKKLSTNALSSFEKRVLYFHEQPDRWKGKSADPILSIGCSRGFKHVNRRLSALFLSIEHHPL